MDDAMQHLILEQLRDLSHEVRGIRTNDLPKLKTEVALIEDRSSRTAKLITAVGAAITLAVSVAVAYFRP